MAVLAALIHSYLLLVQAEDVNVLFILAFLTVFVFSSLIEYYKQKKKAS